MKVLAGAKDALPTPWSVKAFDAVVAYEEEAIEPEIVILPEVIMFPVTVNEPEMYGELSIMLFRF